MPNHYDVGDAVTISAEFHSGTVYTDPDVVVFYAKSPSGVITTYTYPTPPITKSSTGKYCCVFVATEEGKWSYRTYGSGSAYGSQASEAKFIVDDSQFY